MTGPLEGLRVTDLTTAIAGPMCTQILADQGADVIKVEQSAGDGTRHAGPRKGDFTAPFIAVNHNKRSILLDLKTAAGREALTRLIETSDVLVQNFRPGVMEKLGFDWPTIQGLNDKLIYMAMSGYGQTGPYANARVYDPLIQASSGVAATQRDLATGEPVLIHAFVCDKLTALTAAQAVTAALVARGRTGRGQMVELSMLNASLAFMWPDGMWNHAFVEQPPARQDLSDTYRLHKTLDGYIALVPGRDNVFPALCKSLGRQDWLTDRLFSTFKLRTQNAAAWREALAEELLRHTAQDVMEAMIAEGGSAAKLLERPDILLDPQVLHNESVVEFECGVAGRVRVARHPSRFSDTPTVAFTAAPEPGQHTAEILAELGL
jgi:crotonobetainyl-CoA:carnitine CoA-transferase CaiB-like acyl-CoA transferase